MLGEKYARVVNINLNCLGAVNTYGFMGVYSIISFVRRWCRFWRNDVN
tara:strand:+ start:1489 stop:1632 length:144 start_codon:yes stop_codon:yes gene_type:complete